MMQQLEQPVGLRWRCATCGAKLRFQTVLGGYGGVCRECGNRLWCGERVVDGVAILLILPDHTPEFSELDQLVTSLVVSARFPRVIVDLSALEKINSAMLAELVFLRRRLDAVQGSIVLCGLGPLLLQIFARTRIDSLFEIYGSVSEALRAFRSEMGSGNGDRSTDSDDTRRFNLPAGAEDTSCGEDTRSNGTS